MTSLSQASPSKNNLSFYVTLLVVTVLWLLLVHDAIYSAAVIWLGNEIFNHCLLVIPASIYLIWERRKEINWSEARISKWAVFFLFGQLLVFLLGVAGDIQLFKHLAVFTMLPTLFWFFMGDKIAWQLKFPLAFVLFSIPVGEQLIPLLQEITADISVYMLQMTGIPLFRSGLFIEIPQGKFLVAEACSGISFLIASIVIGNLYAYMNLKTMRRRIFFVVLSVIVPILANAVRVYGIILVGYWSNMEHAVGADHLIYGWFFFAIVIIMLLAIGEWIRSRENKALAKTDMQAKAHEANLDSKAGGVSGSSFTYAPKVVSITTIIIAVLLVASLLQAYRMTHLEPPESAYPEFKVDFTTVETDSRQLAWKPYFFNPTKEHLQSYSLDNNAFNIYYAYFDGTDGELISSMHRLYVQDRWTLTERERVTVGGQPMIVDKVASSIGTKRSVYYFYVVDGTWMVSQRMAKMQQVLQTLKGVRSQGAIIAVSFIEDEDVPVNKQEILEKVQVRVSTLLQL